MSNTASAPFRGSAWRSPVLAACLLIGASGAARSAGELSWQVGAAVPLNIGATPVLVTGGAFDFNADGSDDLLYHNVGLPVTGDHYHPRDFEEYTFLFGNPIVPLDQDGRLRIGVDLAGEPALFGHGDLDGDGITDFIGGGNGGYFWASHPCGTDAEAHNSMQLFIGEPEDAPEPVDCPPIAPPADLFNPDGSKIAAIRVLDLNDDGVLDVVVHRVGFDHFGDYLTSGYFQSHDRIDLAIYLGEGEGDFADAQFIDIAQPLEEQLHYRFRVGWVTQFVTVLLETLRAVDHDGDGDLDFVMERLVGGWESYELFVYENDGDGVFQPIPIVFPADDWVAGTPISTRYADWYEALVAPRPPSDDIAILLADVLGVPDATPVVRDFDGDGVADFAVSAPGSDVYPANAWYLFFGLDAQHHDPAPVVMPLDNPGHKLLTAGDIDGNGYPDILLIEPIPEWQGNSVLTPVFNFGSANPTPVPDPPPADGGDVPDVDDDAEEVDGDAEEVDGDAEEVDGDAEEVEFVGRIEAMGDSHVIVAGLKVWHDAETRIIVEGNVPLAVGQTCQVGGMQYPDGQVIASVLEAW